MNVLVIGYYNHSNLGDEQYKTSIAHFLQKLHKDFHKSIKTDVCVDFIDCDQIMDFDVSKYSTVLLGGGDVLNNYFLDKLNKKYNIIKRFILNYSNLLYLLEFYNSKKFYI